MKKKNRDQLANVYESLVTWDKDFNPKSSLAVTWGRLDQKTWELSLRKGVVFHDLTVFDAQDVVFSFEKTKGSQVLENIESLEVIDPYKIRFYTKEPDPFFLHSLTSLWIGSADSPSGNLAIGTGPYFISEIEPYRLSLKRFPSYWGPLAPYEEYFALQEPDPELRVMKFLKGEADVMVQLPPQAFSQFDSENWNLYSFPTLESHFLMLHSRLKENKALQNLLWYALKEDYTQVLGAQQLKSLNQFAASGLTGWIKDFSWTRYQPELAEKARLELDPETVLQIDLPEGLEVLGALISRDLEFYDFQFEVRYWPLEEYEKHILSGQSDIYFFGWKFDHGDLADFFESVLRKGAPYNGIQFEDESFEKAMAEISQELDTEKRKILLDELSARVLQTQQIIPLFETMHSIVTKPELRWRARLDGILYASDFLIKE